MVNSNNIVSSYITSGKIIRKSKTTVEITELPYGEWTENYKLLLCSMAEKGVIKSFTENHSFTKVHFIISATQQVLDEMDETGLIESFKLSANILMTNMHAFDRSSNMKRFAKPEEIVDEYFPVRFDCYTARKAMLTRKYEADVLENKNKSNFINSIIRGEISVNGMRETELLAELSKRGFTTKERIEKVRLGLEPELSKVDGNGGEKGFQYLLNMPIHSFTEERVRMLSASTEAAEKKLVETKRTSESDMWLADLSSLRKKYFELFGK